MSLAHMAVAWESDLPSTQRLVLLCLADHANEAGECFPKIDRIERRTGLKDKAIRLAVKALEQAGWLTAKQTGRAMHYVVAAERPAPRTALTGTTYRSDRHVVPETGTKDRSDRYDVPVASRTVIEPPIQPPEKGAPAPVAPTPPPPRPSGQPLTPGAAVSIPLRREGIDARSDNEHLAQLLADGAAVAEIQQVAREFHAGNKGFAYAMKAMWGRRQDAKRAASQPANTGGTPAFARGFVAPAPRPVVENFDVDDSARALACLQADARREAAASAARAKAQAEREANPQDSPLARAKARALASSLGIANLGVNDRG